MKTLCVMDCMALRTNDIRNNNDLREFAKHVIQESGNTKREIARAMGIPERQLYRKLKKESFSIDDLNEILAVMGLTARTQFHIERKPKPFK